MVGADFSDLLVPVYGITRRHIPKDRYYHILCCENLTLIAFKCFIIFAIKLPEVYREYFNECKSLSNNKYYFASL